MIHLKFTGRLISKDNFKCYNRSGRFYLSKEFKAFEKAVAWEAKSQYKGKLLTEDLKVTIIAYYKNKVHPDTGNLPKSLCDSLNKIIWKDDRQIKNMAIKVIENSRDEWFEIYVEESNA